MAKRRRSTQRDAEAALWRAYKQSPTIDLRNRLVEHYLPLVGKVVACTLQHVANVDREDLESAGVLGLMDAIRAFDPGRGIRFNSFAVLRIRGAAIDELRKLDWVPRLVRQRARQLAAAAEACERRLDRPPTAEELAGELGMTVEAFAALARDAEATSVVSLSTKVYEREVVDELLGGCVADPRTEDPTGRLRRLDVWRSLLEGCSDRERLVLIGYYQLGLGMKTIGKSVGLSESRISQLHSELVARLRARLAFSAEK